MLLYLQKKTLNEMKTNTKKRVTSKVVDFNGMKLVEMSFDVKAMVQLDKMQATKPDGSVTTTPQSALSGAEIFKNILGVNRFEKIIEETGLDKSNLDIGQRVPEKFIRPPPYLATVQDTPEKPIKSIRFEDLAPDRTIKANTNPKNVNSVNESTLILSESDFQPPLQALKQGIDAFVNTVSDVCNERFEAYLVAFVLSLSSNQVNLLHNEQLQFDEPDFMYFSDEFVHKQLDNIQLNLFRMINLRKLPMSYYVVNKSKPLHFKNLKLTYVDNDFQSGGVSKPQPSALLH